MTAKKLDITLPTNNPAPIEQIIEMYQKGMIVNDIAKYLKVTHSAISQRLAPYREGIKGLQTFKNNQADLLTLVKRNILFTLTPDKLKAASAYQLTGMYGIIDERERLARDQSTQNIGISAHYSVFMQAIQGELGRRKHGKPDT